MHESNTELAAVFELVGKALAYQQEAWVKTRAYLQFAELLRTMDEDIDAIDDLEALPGVGKAIAKKVRQWRADGTFPLWDRLHEQVPTDIRAMLTAGVAPATVRHLEAAGFTSVDAVRGRPEEAVKAVPSRARKALREWLSSPASSGTP